MERLKSAKGMIAIVIHSGGDPDAVASAFSLKLLAERLNPEVSVWLFAPGGLNEDGARLSEKLGLLFEERFGLRNAEVVILADTADLPHASLTANDVSKCTDVLVVDHHKTSYPRYVKLALWSERKSSSELVLQLYDEAGVTPDKIVSWALAVGISYDTARLTAIDNRSLLTLARLLKEGVDIKEVLSWTRSEMKKDEKVARIKAAQRAKVLRLHGFLVGVSYVGSYNASAASGLLSLGFDLAVVASERKNAVVVSVRATPEFYEMTKLAVGTDICQAFCKLHGGSGGGHDCVGIIHYALGREEFLKAFLKFLDSRLQGASKPA